ncbi:uncharacterized protein LOC105827798 [Monomorium pharaonis]|uniref:uncharacterized protein LOC105827798 n=1 Tax=Monomorium pharaonis TaxID=307658 RepID=UPI00063FA44B|nr:uncharacterized protein LOC105827798 [Monomorium pharaonis]
MTKCMRKEVNLKSSAYNQTGQNYYEQLEAYNSMSSHLRRILKAKSIVDTRNKNCLKRNQRRKVQRADDNRVCLYLEVTDDVIDKLAYDTKHHPMDMLALDLNAKHLDSCNCNLDHQLRVCSSQTRYEETDQMNRRQRSIAKNQRISPTTACLPKRKKFLISNFSCTNESNSTREIPHIVGPSTCFSRQRKCRYEKEFSIPSTTRLDSMMFKSRSQSPRQKITDYRSVCSSVSQCYDFDCDEKSAEEICKFVSQKEEEKKYTKFIYDITKEIMQRGLYTDKELQDVFKKHVNQHKGILNMNKMLYEIYQLKISLNVVDDSDTDEELEDLIHAQKLLSVSKIRPPTPPKTLNENKVMEKLESYQKMMKVERSPKIARKSVLLVDANPKILVTERDVLMSLIEAGVDPKQVEHICKNLRYKSRDDVDFTEAAQIDTETLCCSNLKVEHLKDNNKQLFIETETVTVCDSHVADSIESPEKLEVSSSTSNLVCTQDEAVEPKEKMESETTLEHDKVEPKVIFEHDKEEPEVISKYDKAEPKVTSEHDKTEPEITSEHDKQEPEFTSEYDKSESEVASDHGMES